LHAIFLFIRALLSKDYPAVVRSQIKYQLLAGVIGFGGGMTNFLPQLFQIYPFGNYLILLYVAFVSYAILKLKLFNMKAIAAELFSGAIILVLLFNLLAYSSFSDFLVKLLLFVLGTSFSIFLIRSVLQELKQREQIEKLAEQLSVANARLKELDQRKSEFVSLASHQLRSPLTAIKGYTSLILEGSFGEVAGKLREVIENIFESSERLVLIIEDFLTISRIEQNKLKYDMSVFDLKDLARAMVNEQTPNIRERGLGIDFEVHPANADYRVKGDVGKMSQVLTNLIDNAIKYTVQGKIEVSVAKMPGTGKVRVAIKDTGLGIAADALPRLFEKFSRAQNANQANVTGSGLGLYVAKQIVEAHKGRIWIESPGEGKGSTFTIELSPSGPPEPAVQEQTGSEPIPPQEVNAPATAQKEKKGEDKAGKEQG
jgi:signal transduction histidine kinase